MLGAMRRFGAAVVFLACGASCSHFTDAPTGDAGADGGSSNDDGGVDAGVPPVTTGDRVVFVSSQIVAGNKIGNIANGDATCNAIANASKHPTLAGKGRRFLAWLSNGTTAAKARLAPTGNSRRIVLVTGTQIALGSDDLLDGSIETAIDVDEGGAKVTTFTVWTGTRPDGTAGGNDCDDWKATTADTGTVGGAKAKDKFWTSQTELPCDTLGRLYCFEQP